MDEKAIKVGMTGGIGCGKSTVADAFRRKGVFLIDADQISHALVEPGMPLLSNIADVFGAQVISESGRLKRSVLKSLVFDSPKKRSQLESLLHPAIMAKIEEAMLEYDQEEGVFPYLIADVPLLLEKGYHRIFDRVLVIDCLPKQQRERVIQRDTMDDELLEKIMHAQVDREYRLSMATDILDNTGDQSHLLRQVDALHSQYMMGF